MIYKVEIEKKVEKQIDKLKDNELKKDIKSKIIELRHNPRKGDHLFKNFYELKAKNYRVYYAIFRGIIVIENIHYDGLVHITDFGDKDSQKRVISSLRSS